MKKLWQIGNILSLAFALIANFLVGAQILDVQAINEISDKYATLLTPATYAFSIWSLVYALLIVFVIYQARDIANGKSSNTLPQKIGPYFIIASICNGLWTFIFVKEWIALSVLVLVILTISLYRLIWRVGVGVADAKRREIMFVWWPLLLYAGWVTVATVVNIASWMASRGLTPSALLCAVLLIALTAALCWLLARRSVRELLLASAWGIAAIGVQQAKLGESSLMMVVSFACALILLLAISRHAYKNRNSLLPH